MPSKPTKRICFVTETDLGSNHITGAIINDVKMLHLLARFAKVDVIYLQKDRYRIMLGYLPVYILQILMSFTRPYRIYFARSVIASFILTLLKPVSRKRTKIVYQAFSVPFISSEVKYLRINRVESFLRFRLYDYFEKKALPKVDVITVAADEYAGAFKKVGINPSTIRVVPFFIEDDFFNKPIKKTGEAFTFCYVGGFHLYHSLLPLIEAFEIVSKSKEDMNLLFIGNGPQKPMLEKEIQKRKLTYKVKFLGSVSHSSLPSFLSEVDCIISLIRKSGMSISLLEAAASGKAIIAFTPDNILNRYFKHREHIFLVHKLSVPEIAKAMEIIYQNSQIRNAIANGARDVTRDFFSEDVVLGRLQRLMKQL